MAEPRFPLANRSDAELERALFDLGQAIDFPATPDLASQVRERLEREAPPIPVRTTRFADRRRVWLAAAALLLVIIGTLILFPEARTAIADRLGLRGVLIEWVEEAPTPAPAPAGAPLLLGPAVTLDEARAAVDFPVVVPTLEGFTVPEEIYLLGLGDTAMVSFVYHPRPGLPVSDVAGVGALLTQFRGDAERNLIEKGLRSGDGASQTQLDAVRVGGEPGFWISGAPHTSFLVCPDDYQCREERYRLAGNVLLWEHDDLTLRLESALSLEEALVIAESVRAPD